MGIYLLHRTELKTSLIKYWRVANYCCNLDMKEGFPAAFVFCQKMFTIWCLKRSNWINVIWFDFHPYYQFWRCLWRKATVQILHPQSTSMLCTNVVWVWLGMGGGCPKYMYLEMKINKYINKNHHFPTAHNPKLKCFGQPKRHHIEHAGFLIRLQKNHTLIFINIYFSVKCMGIGISPILRQLKPIFMDSTL